VNGGLAGFLTFRKAEYIEILTRLEAHDLTVWAEYERDCWPLEMLGSEPGQTA